MIGQRVTILKATPYVLKSNERAGKVVDIHKDAQKRDVYEVVVDNYTMAEPYAGGWDTLYFYAEALAKEESQ